MKTTKLIIKSFLYTFLVMYSLVAFIWATGALVKLDFAIGELAYWNWSEGSRLWFVCIWFLVSTWIAGESK
jgi:hypothetical protein